MHRMAVTCTTCHFSFNWEYGISARDARAILMEFQPPGMPPRPRTNCNGLLAARCAPRAQSPQPSARDFLCNPLWFHKPRKTIESLSETQHK